MATTSTNVWWSSDARKVAILTATATGSDRGPLRGSFVRISATPEREHENATIQRMSEAWRELKANGQA